MSTFVDQLVVKLINKGLTLAVCESITGGMIASNIVNIPNASKIFLGGLVTYNNKSKVSLVNVKQTTIDHYGAISKETAIEMVKGAINKFKADIALAITGNAGPISIGDKSMGLAFLSICIIDKIYTYELQSKEQTRNEIRIDLTYQALNKLYELIK